MNDETSKTPESVVQELDDLKILGAILNRLNFEGRQKYFLLGADKAQEVRFAFHARLPHEKWDHAATTAIKERKSASILVLLPNWERNRFHNKLIAAVQEKGGAVIAGRLFHALWAAHCQNVRAEGSPLPKTQPPRDK